MARSVNAEQMVGTVLDGRYRLTRTLDTGGMGAVFEATSVTTGERLAVKVMHPHLVDEDKLTSRFQREAQAVAAIGHPNIVRVVDCAVAPKKHAYLVMEFLDGQTLAAVLRDTGPMPVGDVVDISLQVLSALGVAHCQDVVHRDLKPANLFVRRLQGGWQVKVLDFGVAKMMESAGYTRLTATGTILGTPGYMAPEQALGGTIDGRTDIYALGIVMYQCLAGRRPFRATNFRDMLFQVIESPPPTLEAIRRDIPPGLCQVIYKALAKRAEDRFQVAADMATALAPYTRAQTSDEARTLTMPARKPAAPVVPIELDVPPAAADTIRGHADLAEPTIADGGPRFEPEPPDPPPPSDWRFGARSEEAAAVVVAAPPPAPPIDTTMQVAPARSAGIGSIVMWVAISLLGIGVAAGGVIAIVLYVLDARRPQPTPVVADPPPVLPVETGGR